MSNTKNSTQNNINVYNAKRVSELKVIQKFLNAMFPVPSSSSTTKKTTSTKTKKPSNNTVSESESHVQ